MKKNEDTDELRAEYDRKDLKKGTRGKYFDDYRRAHNLVLLDPEVAKRFPDEKSVNDALRSLISTPPPAGLDRT